MDIDKIIKILKKELKHYKNPIITEIADLNKDPFKVLISCILSLRTKDEVTAKASKRLFEKASKPEEILKLSTEEIEKLIYPVGFYKTKAKNIKEVCKDLIEKYDSKVPNNENELLKLNNVGRKTMGIVMCYGFGKNSYIPVDSHVHIISNRLGLVKTKTPEKTEQELYKIIPKKHWHDYNDLMVKFGQNICLSNSPYCSKCPINKYCKKIGLKHSR